jgi:MFS transporter, DHA2 family, metal-tetracycline-proton antiporter
MSPSQSNRAMLYWSVLTFIVVANASLFNVALPKAMDELSLHAAQSSWLVAAYSAAFAAATFTYARLTDRLPLHRLLAFGLMVCGAASAAGLWSPSYGLLLFERFIQALGAAALPGLSFVYIVRFLPPERRSHGLAQLAGAIAMGLGAGPLLGGMLTEVWGWRSAFLIPSLTLLAAPFTWRLLSTERQMQESEAPTDSHPEPILSVLRGLWMRRSYTIRIGLQFGLYFVQMAILYVLPLYLSVTHRFSAWGTGMILFPGAALTAFAVLRRSRSIQKADGHIDMFISFILLTAGGITLANSTDWPGAAGILGYGLITGGTALAGAALNMQISKRLAPREAGLGMGLSQLVQLSGGAVGAAVSGFVLGHTAEPPAHLFFILFLMMSGIALLLLVLYTIQARKENYSSL